MDPWGHFYLTLLKSYPWYKELHQCVLKSHYFNKLYYIFTSVNNLNFRLVIIWNLLRSGVNFKKVGSLLCISGACSTRKLLVIRNRSCVLFIENSSIRLSQGGKNFVKICLFWLYAQLLWNWPHFCLIWNLIVYAVLVQ